MTEPDLSPLVANWLPQSHWSLGGAVQFGLATAQAVAAINKLLAGARRIETVHASPACAWTLDWGRQRSQSSPSYIHQQLKIYADMGVAVCLSFDNPFIPGAALGDSFGLFLVDTLLRLNPTGRNSVAVADDRLAMALLKQWPKLPLEAHVNRVVSESGEAGQGSPDALADLYKRLAQVYRRVSLLPEDALDSAVVNRLPAAVREASSVAINDGCRRGARALRREFLLLCAQMRVRPYHFDFAIQRRELRDRLLPGPLDPAPTSHLSHAELRQLDASGVKSFHVQAEQCHNGMTPLWALLRHLLDPSPENTRRAALLASHVFVNVSGARSPLASGLQAFTVDLPE